MSAPCPVLGFYVRLDVRSGTETAEELRQSLAELLDSEDLVADERDERDDRALAWAVHREGAQATEADRQIVIDWSERSAAAGVVTVSDLVDLNPGA